MQRQKSKFFVFICNECLSENVTYEKCFMNKFFLSILTGMLVLVSCEKSKVKIPETYSRDIEGKWNYTQKFYSDGSQTHYESTSDLNQWVIFNADSSFSSNMPVFETFAKYSILDSFRLKLTSGPQQQALYLFHIDSLQHSLSLSSLDFICIEGCGDIFKK